MQITWQMVKQCGRRHQWQLLGMRYMHCHLVPVSRCVTMGFPISPIVVKLLMEEFENKANNTAIKSPRIWKRYFDNMY